MQDLVLLGATGSIGQSTCDLVRRHPDRFRLVGLSAHANASQLAGLAEEFEVDAIALSREDVAKEFAAQHPRVSDRLLAPGEAGLLELIDRGPDDAIVVNGLVGAAGLRPTVHALERGLDVALANKEALVVGGELVLDAAERNGARLWPVDSEHSAIAQCLRGNPREELARIWLTASGGPFRDRDPRTLATVTLEEVLNHPTWDMGPKISVDSATMMNKGLEVIEAHLLFGTPLADVHVVIHRQSIVHSMVELVDGAFLAQLGAPDMRVPILYAISKGRHVPTDVAPFHPLSMGRLEFEEPDPARYPCLGLARAAAERGGAGSIVLNAANEEAVAGLLAGSLSFLDIPAVIEAALERVPLDAVGDVDGALDRDAQARVVARELLRARARTEP